MWSSQLLNVPNVITLARLPLFAWFVWEAHGGSSGLAFGIFVLVWALDWVDGALARRLRQTTQAGYYLDKIVDRLVMVLGVVVMIRYNILPPAALLLMVRDIGYLPATYPFQKLEKNWRGARKLGKAATLLQGVGFIWLHFSWPYPALIIAVTAALGGFVAFRHLRGLMVAAVVLFALPVAAHASVILNELMWDGVEYVELYNNGSGATSLADWKLTRQQSDGEEKTILVFGEGAVIAAGGYFLIEKNEDATTVVGDAIAGSLVLIQGGELVRLYNAGGTVADSAGQFGAWPAGKNTDTGISMERSGDGWHTSTGSSGGRSGTPRAANSNGLSGDSEATSNNEEEQPDDSQQNYSTPVVINEFLPNPEGDDSAGEFIELYNPSGQATDLSGWQLDDAVAGSKAFTIPDNTTVSAGAYKIFMRGQTGIALNNTGDDVRLLDPNGKVHAQASYNETAPGGQSYNRLSGSYVRSTTTTPGSENVITEPVAEVGSQAVARASTKPTISPSQATKTAGAGAVSVVIHRALPDPVGDDTSGEFITLKNTGNASVDLSGWQLDDEDGGSRPYTIPDGVMIIAGATLTFSREDTGIALNNNGDAVRLLTPDGAVVDTLEYSDITEGQILEAGGNVAGSTTTAGSAAANTLAGVQTAAAAPGERNDSENSEPSDGAPQAIAQLTGGGNEAGSAEQANAPSTSNTRGIAVGIVLVLGAAAVAALTFGDKDMLRRWVTSLIGWRRPQR